MKNSFKLFVTLFLLIFSNSIVSQNQFEDTIIVYPQNNQLWTGSTDGTIKADGEINTVYPNVGWAVYELSDFPSCVGAIMSVHFFGYVNATNWPYWSVTPMGTVNPIIDDANVIYSQIVNNYQKGVAYSHNVENGTLPNNWLDRPLETSATSDFFNSLNRGWFAIGLVDFDFYSTYYINFDGWTQPHIPYLKVVHDYLIPVEMISFTAKANDDEIILTWQTATETNNQGFEIQRLQDYKIEKLKDWERIGFVEGNGTTTERKYYSFTDRPDPGKYKYRLKQIDFDGSFEYSSEVEAEILAPLVFSLEQNYPNPFNPTTVIRFQIPGQAWNDNVLVTLKIYDVLGREVAILVNEEKQAGRYEVEFNAGSLPSGIYFYRMEADGYVNVKKMIVMK